MTDSPAVELVLSLLTLADHPGDKTARFHLARSPLGQSWGLADHKDSPAAWRLAEQIRHRLMVDGYGPTIYGWAKELSAVCDSRDASRLEQLVEMAYGYEDRATNRPGDFVALVQQQKVEDPTSARVRVMTVHQAKGLGFDIVVLPELDQEFSGQTPEIVVGYPKPAARIDRVCRYVSKKLRAILPAEFQRMLAAHEQRVVEESLCLLYVALTRARYSLCMVIAPSSDNEKKVPSTFAGVLRAALVGSTSPSSRPQLLTPAAIPSGGKGLRLRSRRQRRNRRRYYRRWFACHSGRPSRRGDWNTAPPRIWQATAG